MGSNRFHNPRRGGVARSQRRATNWTIGPVTTPQSLASSEALLGTSFVTGIGGDGLTLVRTRGDMLIYLQSAAAAGDGFAGAVGIGIASSAAISIGVSAVPTPLTEEDADNWIWHEYFNIFAPGIMDGTAVADTNLFGPAFVRIPIDSKAMRKVPDEDVGLYMALEVVETGTATGKWVGRTRMLEKLS